MTGPRRFVVTVDDPGGLIQDIPTLRRALTFFDEQEVPASFFVVPRGEGGWRVDRQKEWLAVAREAEQRGHDCQLHGLDHRRGEFGPAPSFIRALGGKDPDETLHSDIEQFGRMWHRRAYTEKLSTAIRLFEDAFGRKPLALRTGALSQTPELYDAVADAGMRYVSNTVVDPRGWAYIIGKYDAPGDWDPHVPPAPYYITDKVINLPMISEYAWKLTPEAIDRHLALAVEDMERVYAAGGVFLLICHVQEVGAREPRARVLLGRLLDAARGNYDVTFQTVTGLIADIESGAVPVLPYEPRIVEGGHYHGR